MIHKKAAKLAGVSVSALYGWIHDMSKTNKPIPRDDDGDQEMKEVESARAQMLP